MKTVKRLLAITALATLSNVSLAAVDPKLILTPTMPCVGTLVIAGQSNAVRMVSYADILKQVNKAFSGCKITVKTLLKSGSFIESFFAGTQPRAIFDKEMLNSPPVIGVFYWQAEADAAIVGGQSATPAIERVQRTKEWPVKLHMLVRTLIPDNMGGTFVVVALNGTNQNEQWQNMRKNQLALNIPHVKVIDSDKYKFLPDYVHGAPESFNPIFAEGLKLIRAGFYANRAAGKSFYNTAWAYKLQKPISPSVVPH